RHRSSRGQLHVRSGSGGPLLRSAHRAPELPRPAGGHAARRSAHSTPRAVGGLGRGWKLSVGTVLRAPWKRATPEMRRYSGDAHGGRASHTTRLSLLSDGTDRVA